MVVRYHQALPQSSACRFVAVHMSSTSWSPTDAERCSAAPSVSVIGEIIDESIASRPRKQTFMTVSLRPSDRDTCGLRILMIQNRGPHGARVPTPQGPAWMVLESDMRARSSNDRFRPHAHGHGASARGECAIGACRSRRWRRPDGRDDDARSKQKFTKNV